MNRSLTSLVAFCVGLMMAAQAWAMSYSGVYAFGDSLSDAGASPSAVLSIYKLLGGSCDPYHPCPPYDAGRYSNGPVAAEYLANAVLPGGANATNFFDFAVAGATTGIGNYGDGGTAGSAGLYGLPGMAQEVAFYLSKSGGAADPNALYFVWGGANDFLSVDSPVLAAQRVASYVDALASAGAAHILVPNLPDLSLTPFVQGAGLQAQAQAQAFSLSFNATLAALLDGLSGLLPAADIVRFDTYAFLNDVVAHPADYGFTDSQNACLPSLLAAPCANPDGYVFWDDFHPTTRADAVIAGAFARTVPEPATLALVALGLASLLLMAKRRRQARRCRAR